MIKQNMHEASAFFYLVKRKAFYSIKSISIKQYTNYIKTQNNIPTIKYKALDLNNLYMFPLYFQRFDLYNSRT